MVGFLPGYPYMGDLPGELALPRRENPRTKVPRGSVAIATTMTAVYTLESPGGWHLIGRTPAPLWDLRRDPPAVLAPGDKVLFEPVSLAGVRGAGSAGGRGRVAAEPEEPPARAARMTPALRVIAPGLMTTVQDLGRPGYQRLGIPVSGALDHVSLCAANLIVGNPPGTGPWRSPIKAPRSGGGRQRAGGLRRPARRPST